MNKIITIFIKDKKFNFRDRFVWRDGFDLYLTIDEAGGKLICNKNLTLCESEYSLHKDDYKKAFEKYKKLRIFM